MLYQKHSTARNSFHHKCINIKLELVLGHLSSWIIYLVKYSENFGKFPWNPKVICFENSKWLNILYIQPHLSHYRNYNYQCHWLDNSVVPNQVKLTGDPLSFGIIYLVKYSEYFTNFPWHVMFISLGPHKVVGPATYRNFFGGPKSSGKPKSS